jgi:hypothetical protein
MAAGFRTKLRDHVADKNLKSQRRFWKRAFPTVYLQCRAVSIFGLSLNPAIAIFGVNGGGGDSS